MKTILGAVLATVLFAGCMTEKCTQCEQSKLAAAAKVSKADAQATALAKVPGGTVKDGELEKEKGKLIWSFDINLPNTTDIKEVAVDAITGEVLAVDTETAADQAKEAAEDAKKK